MSGNFNNVTFTGFSKIIRPLTKKNQSLQSNPIPTPSAPNIIVTLSIGTPAAAQAMNKPKLKMAMRTSRIQLPSQLFYL
jgi:hypothetical protein